MGCNGCGKDRGVVFILIVNLLSLSLRQLAAGLGDHWSINIDIDASLIAKRAFLAPIDIFCLCVDEYVLIGGLEQMMATVALENLYHLIPLLKCAYCKTGNLDMVIQPFDNIRSA